MEIGKIVKGASKGCDILICIFIIEIIHVLLDFTKKKLVYRDFLEYVVNACGSWFFYKRYTLRVFMWTFVRIKFIIT